ncbi:MAG: hypothetical protein ACRC80_22410 [Waterburya sp.]
MVTSINWTKKAIANITLKSVYQEMNLDNQSDIPLIIRLLENPNSLIITKTLFMDNFAPLNN